MVVVAVRLRHTASRNGTLRNRNESINLKEGILKMLKFVEKGTEVDHSNVRGEICFLEEVKEEPKVPVRANLKEITEGVWELHFLTDPDDRWVGSPRHKYRVRYYLPGKREEAEVQV